MLWKILSAILILAIVACTPVGPALSGMLPDGWQGAEMSTETKFMIAAFATVGMVILVGRFIFWVMIGCTWAAGRWLGRQIIRATLWKTGIKGRSLLRDAFVFMVWSDMGERDLRTVRAVYNRVWGIEARKRAPVVVDAPVYGDNVVKLRRAA